MGSYHQGNHSRSHRLGGNVGLNRQLRRDYPKAKILGHYQLSPYIRKACPCFDARSEYAEL